MNIDSKVLPRHFLLSKSRYGSFRLVFYKDNTDDIMDAQAKDVEQKTDERTEDEEEKNALSLSPALLGKDEDARNYELEALLRAKRTILDLALNNPFCYFCTFTFDQTKIDRNNIENTKNKFLEAIDNYNLSLTKNNKPTISYIAVPEWHKKHDAIHFHCLMNNIDDLEFVKIDEEFGHNIYRSRYFFDRFGSCTIIPIQDYNKYITYYITKYVTKSNLKIFDSGSQRYFRSKGLDRSMILARGNVGKMYSNQVETIKEMVNKLVPDYTSGFIHIYNLDDLDTVQRLIECSNEMGD